MQKQNPGAALEAYLLQALARLEKASEAIRKTQGYTRETAKVRILTELVREQVPHENTRDTTRQTR